MARRRIFEAELNGLRELLAGKLGQQGEGEVDPRRHAAARDEIAIADDAAGIGRGAKQGKQVPRGPVTGCAAALAQPRRTKDQRTGADGREIARASAWSLAVQMDWRRLTSSGRVKAGKSARRRSSSSNLNSL